MLNDQVLRRLDALSLQLKEYARGGAGGMRKSKALGTSVEFSDYREYAQGDDIRRVDWNAYARFGRLFLKLFMEEMELHMTVVLDASASMDFGEPTKWAFAVQIAEAMGYMALNKGDRVAYAVVSGGEASVSPLFSGRHGYLRASDFLAGIKPGGRTSLSRAVTRLPLGAQRGLTVVISDLFSEDGSEKALSSLLYRRQQVALVQTLCAEEFDPTLDGAVKLVDCESGETIDIMAGQPVMREYRKALEGFLGETSAFCRARGIGYACLSSEMDILGGALAKLVRAGIIA